MADIVAILANLLHQRAEGQPSHLVSPTFGIDAVMKMKQMDMEQKNRAALRKDAYDRLALEDATKAHAWSLVQDAKAASEKKGAFSYAAGLRAKGAPETFDPNTMDPSAYDRGGDSGRAADAAAATAENAANAKAAFDMTGGRDPATLSDAEVQAIGQKNPTVGRWIMGQRRIAGNQQATQDRYITQRKIKANSDLGFASDPVTGENTGQPLPWKVHMDAADARARTNEDMAQERLARGDTEEARKIYRTTADEADKEIGKLLQDSGFKSINEVPAPTEGGDAYTGLRQELNRWTAIRDRHRLLLSKLPTSPSANTGTPLGIPVALPGEKGSGNWQDDPAAAKIRDDPTTTPEQKRAALEALKAKYQR